MHESPAANRESYKLDDSLWTTGRNVLIFIALISWAASAIGFSVNRAQFHFSWMVSSIYFTTIMLGAMFFVFLQHLGGAAWSVTVRRLAESMMAAIPVGVFLFFPNMLGLGYLYEWAHPAAVAADRILREKAVVLNPTFFNVRIVVYFLIWSVFAVKLYSLSVEQDETRDLDRLASAKKWSAFGILILTVTVTQAAYDWLMSLDPHWYSTMFGLYVYAGGAMAFMGLLIIVCVAFRSWGVMKESITFEHYHDLGKLLFAFMVFWAYCAFSQYMLIWYGNLPEETEWFKHRLSGGWHFAQYLLVFGHFVIPFVVLMARFAKRNLTILVLGSLWLMAMHYFDIFWIVMPYYNKNGFSYHWIDLASLLAVGSTYGLVFWSRLRRNALVPVGDFRLAAALEFRNY